MKNHWCCDLNPFCISFKPTISFCCHILEICKSPFCINSWISCFSILKCSHKHCACHITVKNTQWKHLGKHIFFEYFGIKSSHWASSFCYLSLEIFFFNEIFLLCFNESSRHKHKKKNHKSYPQSWYSVLIRCCITKGYSLLMTVIQRKAVSNLMK